MYLDVNHFNIDMSSNACSHLLASRIILMCSRKTVRLNSNSRRNDTCTEEKIKFRLTNHWYTACPKSNNFTFCSSGLLQCFTTLSSLYFYNYFCNRITKSPVQKLLLTPYATVYCISSPAVKALHYGLRAKTCNNLLEVQALTQAAWGCTVGVA